MSFLSRDRQRGGTLLKVLAVVALATGVGVTSAALGGVGAERSHAPQALAAGSPGFGDLTLDQMLAARKGIPVPKNLPNFHGVTVTTMGDAGHNMNVFGFWFPEWKKAGITFKAIEVPFADVYTKEKAEFLAGTSAVDLVVFYPAYIGDFASNGYLRPLDDYVR